MKSLLLILFTFIASAQTIPKFTYSATVTNGSLNIKFLNEPSGIGTSSSKFGYFSISCRENYIEFIVQILKLSGTPNRYQNVSVQIEEITIMLQPNNPFIWIIDNLGRVWKISKAKALILAQELNTSDFIQSFNVCYICN